MYMHNDIVLYFDLVFNINIKYILIYILET